jgi:hypothetical protein
LRNDERVLSPPSVSGPQWLLAALSLTFGVLGSVAESHEDLALVALAMTITGSVLTWDALTEALRTRIAGKCLLLISLFWMYDLEIASAALQSPPFKVLNEIPITSPQYSPALVSLGLFYVALFQVALLIGYSIRPKMKRLLTWTRARTDRLTGIGNIRFVYAFCILIPIVLDQHFNPSAIIDYLVGGYKRFAVESDLALWPKALSIFGVYGGSILLAEGLLFRTPRRMLCIASGALVALVATLGGTRHIVLFIALPLMAISLAQLGGQIQPNRILRWCAGLVVFFLIIQVQAAVRSRGWDRVSELEFKDLFPAKQNGQFDCLLLAEELVPKYHAYFLDPVEPYFVIMWIPRTVWPDKPAIPSWKYYNDMYTNRDRVWNVTQSVIGQYHMSWGAPGVIFIGLWLGFLMYCADFLFGSLRIESQKAVAVFIGIFYAFLMSSFRNYLPFYMTYVVCAFVAMLTLTATRGSNLRRNEAASERTLSAS